MIQKKFKGTTYFIFQNDGEIKDWIRLLKEMKKSKISIIRWFENSFALHNGKASIPDYKRGYKRAELLRNAEKEVLKKS